MKETVHPVIFDAMHVDRKRLVSRLELRDLFEDNGVDPEKFDKAFDSFGVDLKSARRNSGAVSEDFGHAFNDGGGQVPDRDAVCRWANQYAGDCPLSG